MAGLRLPEIVSAQPSAPIVLRWVVAGGIEPRDPAQTVPGAVRRAGAHVVEGGDRRWEILVPWRTLVYGVIRRDVDEQALLTVLCIDEEWQARLECLPLQTHSAHAAGAAGVAVLAAAAWFIGGWSGGLLPAFAVAAAGGLLADWTRVAAWRSLELRLRALVEAVGLELWPTAPAQLLPPPTPRI